MDVQMPMMDGYEATRRTRHPESKVRDRGIPIIGMTANAMEGDREKCMEAGMDDYISKPISRAALAGVVEKWMGSSGSPAMDATVASLKSSGQAEMHDPSSAMDIPRARLRVWNKASFTERMMGDVDLAETVVETFLSDMPIQIESLRGYIETGKGSLAERVAHAIKGAAANVSGEALRSVSSSMEAAARTEDMEALRALMPDLITEFDRLKHEMGLSV
jgi:CheY-like chemotaxis protein